MTAILLMFFLFGPPVVIHAVLLERVTIGDAMRLVRLRVRKRALDAVFTTCLLGLVVAAVRVRARDAAARPIEGVSSVDRFPGLLLDGALWGLISTVTLTYMAALWLVACLNARLLSEGRTRKSSRTMAFPEQGEAMMSGTILAWPLDRPGRSQHQAAPPSKSDIVATM